MSLSQVIGSSLAQRSRWYAAFAAAFRYPTDEDVCGQTRAALADLPLELSPGDALQAEATPTLEALQDAYTRLFDVGSEGGPPCSLYGGEYGGGRMGVLEDVLRFYRFFGLRMEPARRERPDHLATELELLHWLAWREAAAAAGGEGGAAAADFLAAHALPLARAVAERLAGRAEPFYPALARLLAGVCAADLAGLRGADGRGTKPRATDGEAGGLQERVLRQAQGEREGTAGQDGRGGPRAAGAPELWRLYEAGDGEAGPYSLRAVRTAPIRWDRVVKASHIANCWYQRACNLNLYVWDGVVLREEQAGLYPAPNDPEVPDPNPRGCNKGMCYAHRTYDPTRVKYPLKRAGERGEGRWQRVSWEQALTDIADNMLDVLTTDGPEVITQGGGTHVHSHGSEALAQNTFFDALGCPVPSLNAEIGDDHEGAAKVFGKIMFADSADNWFHANVILIWGGNPAYTNMPNYHYISEARYRGSKVITIAPDYSPSAIHADQWVPVNVGSDAALALSISQVILEDRLFKAAFVREQTDLPLLVRKDTGAFLRERDFKRGGREDLFYVWDRTAGRVAQAPHKALALNGLEPTLEGEYTVQTLQGAVRARPVFELLREHLDRRFSPELAAEISGVPAATIRQLAREIATAGGVVTVSTANWGKFYHGDLIERAIILVHALAGHIGRKGATFGAFPALSPDTAQGAMERRGHELLLSSKTADPRYAGWKEDGYTTEMILYEYAKEVVASGAITLTGLFHYLHSGLWELSERNNSWDPHLKRPVREYLREALSKGWQVVTPPPEKAPRILFHIGGNVLHRGRATNQMVNTLVPKVKLMVTIDWRMNTTGRYSDYILPACGYYERNSTYMLTTPQCPYMQVNIRAVEPLYESASEWTIFVRLARKIGERARARGIATFRDRDGKERRLDRLEEVVTAGGLYTEDDDESVARDAFVNTGNVEPLTWEEVRERGFAAYTGLGTAMRSIGNATDLTPGEPIVPLTWHTDGKEPYPTLTRRMQFYLDHEWFRELEEDLPNHKAPPSAGGDYPLQMTSGHARWSIHSNWVDDSLLLSLQRGEPTMFISRQDAAARGVRDGSYVHVFNDVGGFRVQAAVSSTVRPGQVIVYHAWENYQFKDWQHFKSVHGSPLNPIELVGGYGHIRPDALVCSPGLSDRGTRVEVRAAAG